MVRYPTLFLFSTNYNNTKTKGRTSSLNPTSKFYSLNINTNLLKLPLLTQNLHLYCNCSVDLILFSQLAIS